MTADPGQAPTGVATSYNLPAYAQNNFGPNSGVPWGAAKPIPRMNFYSGIVKNSFHQFPNAVFYESKFAIDNDGSGGNEGGDIHHRSDTSLHDSADTALDARLWPYIVLPLPSEDPGCPKWSDLGIDLGDLAVCFFKNGKSCAAIYGDAGSAMKLGEGSMQAARELGINPDPNVGGIGANEVPPGVLHVVFPNSRNLLPKGASHRPRTADTIQTVNDRARKLFEQFKQGASPAVIGAVGADEAQSANP